MEPVDSKDFVLTYAPEPIHKINHATQKTVVVIGKEHFLMCKQLMQDNAHDEEYSKLLNIPMQKIRYFKHKMQIFEDRIRARRRAARLNRRRGRRNRKKPEGSLLNGSYIKKKEMTAEERFKYARELILENYSTQEIAKVLRVSERSVTRFRRRLNEQKRKLQEEGKLAAENVDEEEEYKFKFLSAEVKAEKINELYEKGEDLF
jgi:predicted transcriptional regulator